MTKQKTLFSDENFQFLVQSLPVGIIITSFESDIIFINQKMEEMSGYKREELIGEKATKLLADQSDQAKIIKGIDNWEGEVSKEFILNHKHKDGTIWVGKIIASPFTGSVGKIQGTVGFISDITQQVKNDQQLKSFQNQYQELFEHTHDAVVIMDKNGQIAECNKAAMRLYDIDEEEELPVLFAKDMVHPDDLEKIPGYLDVLLNVGHCEGFEVRIITPKNKIKHIQISSTSKFENGRFAGSRDVIRDITNQKRVEEDLINAKLAAENARKAEQSFLANMSHEIRTPMNAVIGMTHLLYDTQPSSLQKEYLDSLRFSADSLMGLINNILDLSKIEAEEVEFEKRKFNLAELLTGLQNTFQFKIREKPVSVVFDLDPKIQNHLIGDSIRLNQILTNLLGNASKFTQRGTIGIKAILIASPPNQYIIQFRVHDSGIGIAKDKVDLIFENFKQADINTTRKYGGSGLGLTIVKQLVELQGGSIEVQSTLGEGSTFIVNLPFENSGEEAEDGSQINQDEDSIEDFLPQIKILVVEDNAMNQKLIKRILELWKCPFIIANDGIEAVKITKDEKFDIILMDIHMPEMDGVEATINIRESEDNINQKTPIIALTAAALLDEKNRALNSGMNDFLTKPFAPTQLKRLIKKWLKLEKNADLSKAEKAQTTQPQDSKAFTIDLTYLKEMSQGDDLFVPDMIQLFIDEVPPAMKEMKEKGLQKNWDNVAAIAHRINSNYMMMGMQQQKEVAQKIEQNIKLEKIDQNQLAEMIDGLQKDSLKAIPLLKDELAKISRVTN